MKTTLLNRDAITLTLLVVWLMVFNWCYDPSHRSNRLIIHVAASISTPKVCEIFMKNVNFYLYLDSWIKWLGPRPASLKVPTTSKAKVRRFNILITCQLMTFRDNLDILLLCNYGLYFILYYVTGDFQCILIFMKRITVGNLDNVFWFLTTL